MSDTSDRSAATSTTNSGTGSQGGGSEGSGGRLSAATAAAGDAYRSARERTSAAYSAARERAGNVGQATAERIDATPMAAVIGGLALGAIAGALIPRSERERDLLGSAGRKLNETARGAVQAAKQAGLPGPPRPIGRA